MPVLGAIDDLEAMEFRGSDTRGVPMATTVQVVVVVDETSQQAADTDDFELQITTAAAAQKDSTEKTALAVAATAAVDLINLFFVLRGDTDTDIELWRRWGWTGGISVLFAFAALLSAAGLVLVLHSTVVVSAAPRRVLMVASAAALFMASTGTVLSLLGRPHTPGVTRADCRESQDGPNKMRMEEAVVGPAL